MSDIIGMIGAIQVERYAVLQVDDGDGRGWLDFSTLRERWELETAVRMVDNRGGVNGFRVADYRIWQDGRAIYVNDPNRFKVAGIEFETHDVLQVKRLDDDEDLAAGWTTCRVICTIADAEIAVERCSRFREPEAKRHYRVVSNSGSIRLSQNTYNSLRLSGILWSFNPLRLNEDLATDRYDRFAARIMESEDRWDEQTVPMLGELNADQLLRDRIYSFIALSF